MPRIFSSTALQGINAQDGGTGFIALVTITHSTLPTPIRVTSDAVNTVSRTNTFTPFPWEMQLPSDAPDQIPQAKILLDNIDRSIYQAIRNAGNVPPQILIEIVSIATPNTVEYSSSYMTLRNVKVDEFQVEGTLGFEDILNEPFPGDLITPGNCPGAFTIDE